MFCDIIHTYNPLIYPTFVVENDQSLYLPLFHHQKQLSCTIAEWQRCTVIIESDPSQPDVTWPNTVLPVTLPCGMGDTVVGDDCDSDDESDRGPLSVTSQP